MRIEIADVKLDGDEAQCFIEAWWGDWSTVVSTAEAAEDGSYVLRNQYAADGDDIWFFED